MAKSPTTLPKFEVPRRPTVPERYIDLIPSRTAWFRQPPPFNGDQLSGIDQVESGVSPATNLALFHDGASENLALVPIEDGSGMVLRGEGFEGSYLSLVFNLGETVAKRIEKQDIVRAAGLVAADDTQSIYLRLNLVSGPSKLTLPMQVHPENGAWMTEWDVFYTEFDPTRGNDMWVDMIFNRSGNFEIALYDFYLLRHPRANM